MQGPQLLRAMFDAAVATAHPSRCVPPHLPAKPTGRTIVIGAGKAAAAMAQAVEQHWQGPLSGLVITRYQHGAPCKQIEVVEAGHPVPDAAGQAGAERMLDLLHGLTADDLVLCLISGGGSSLLSLAPLSVPLEDKRSVTKTLLKCGAAIHEINCVRKHLSRIKGGRLALAAAPARVVSLMISDVPGDDLSVIASGPTVADPSTRIEALAVLEKYRIAAPASVVAWLNNPASETPKPGDPRLSSVQNILIATPQASLQAAAQLAQQAGIATLILGDDLEGEARDCASMHAQLAQQCQHSGAPANPPCVIISGGETTVTVRGQGRGGRNAEFLLSLGLSLNGQADTWAIACDTDGIDGTETNAGALIGPEFLQHAQKLKLQPSEYLANNDAFTLFEQMNALITTGPTRTNVNDFRAIYIGRKNMNHAADEAKLQALEAQRGEALVNRDHAALEQLFADDLVHVHTTGIQQNKTEVIDYAMNTLQFLSVTRQDLKLRFYGNDVAIMNGGMANTMCRSDNPEKIVSAEALVTQVWLRTGDTWQQVSFHACRAAENK